MGITRETLTDDQTDMMMDFLTIFYQNSSLGYRRRRHGNKKMIMTEENWVHEKFLSVLLFKKSEPSAKHTPGSII
jgi:hypothetical protein